MWRTMALALRYLSASYPLSLAPPSAGTFAASTMEPWSPHQFQQSSARMLWTRPAPQSSRSRPREPRQKPQQSASAQSREPSRLPQIARLGAALCLVSSISSCALLPHPEATPAPVQVVCADMIKSDRCPAPQYVFGDAITADVAAAVAIAESKARDACAEQLDALQDCVSEHNEKTPH